MLFAWLVALAQLQDSAPPAGRVVPDVQCAKAPSQSYALYLPSAYTPSRAWPMILGFDPGGRGTVPVERYQAAAEQYGYIVAGSNNSRNGAPEVGRIVATLTGDLFARLSIDERRVYAAGMSGGARVAFLVALGSNAIAGVMASSAGYPDATPRKRLPFPVFATTGTEDFNHMEMRLLDRELTTPHRLVVFEGGHRWLSAELATEAVEWMEVQAMKSRLKPTSDDELDRILAKRTAAANALTDEKEAFLACQSIAADFDGLRDVSTVVARAAALGRNKTVRDALKKDRDEDNREMRILEDVKAAELHLANNNERTAALIDLRQRWKELSDKAKKPDDSPERRLARRVLAGLGAGVRTTDPEYLKIIAEYRVARGGR